MLYHMGARNFECNQCGNKFFQMEHLKRHLQSIHNTIFETKTSSNTTSGTSVYSKSYQPKKKRQAVNPPLLLKSEQNKPAGKTEPIASEEEKKTVEKPVEPVEKVSLDSCQLIENNLINYTESSAAKSSIKTSYTCTQCEYSSVGLFNLNQHIIRDHLRNEDLKIKNPYSSYANVIDQDELLMPGDETEDEMAYNNSYEDVQHLNDISNGIDPSVPFFFCSFCANFRTNTKSLFKRHLKSTHGDGAQVISSLPPPSHLLAQSNEFAAEQPYASYKCDTCHALLMSLNEFVAHMNDVHKYQVQFVDVNMSQAVVALPVNKETSEVILCFFLFCFV
jgi:DNA-directed RNA polymerase subunit RPC12/RpoP